MRTMYKVFLAQGLFELAGICSFLCGYFLDIYWLLLLGGCLIVTDDLISVSLGALKPHFPVLLAVILAIIFTPWYEGVFWASAIFKIFNIPFSALKVFRSSRIILCKTDPPPREIMDKWIQNSIDAGEVRRPLSKLAETEQSFSKGKE